MAVRLTLNLFSSSALWRSSSVLTELYTSVRLLSSAPATGAIISNMDWCKPGWLSFVAIRPGWFFLDSSFPSFDSTLGWFFLRPAKAFTFFSQSFWELLASITFRFKKFSFFSLSSLRFFSCLFCLGLTYTPCLKMNSD